MKEIEIYLVLGLNEEPSYCSSTYLSPACLTREKALEYFNERIAEIKHNANINENYSVTESLDTKEEEASWAYNYMDSGNQEYVFYSVNIVKRKISVVK